MLKIKRYRTHIRFGIETIKMEENIMSKINNKATENTKAEEIKQDAKAEEIKQDAKAEDAKAEDAKAEDAKAEENKPLSGDVVNNSLTAVDSELRKQALDKIHNAVIDFDNKHWALAQAIYDVKTSDTFEKAFKNLEDFANALNTTKGTVSKYVNSIEFKNYLEDKGVVCDFSMSQVGELLKTFNDYKRLSLDFKAYLDKWVITADMSIKDIRATIKKSQQLQVEVKKSEDAKAEESKQDAKAEESKQDAKAEESKQDAKAEESKQGVQTDDKGNVTSVDGVKNNIVDAESHIDLCIKGIRAGIVNCENSEMALDIAMVLYKYGYTTIVNSLIENNLVSPAEVLASRESLSETIAMIDENMK